jgi:mannosyltransferase
MKLFLDNIIFSIQKGGGISVVWQENLKRLIKDNDLNYTCLEYENKNIFRKKIRIPEDRLLYKKPRISLQIERYLNPKVNSNDKLVFHSSYYRYVKAPNIKNITTVHDFTYEHYRKGLPKLIHHKQKYKAIHNSDTIICISEHTKLDLIKFCPKISEEKIKVVYNGVDTEYRVLDSEIDFIPYEKGEYLLYVGDRKSSHKNFKLAVEASVKVNLPLVIVGRSLDKSEEIYLNTLLFNSFFLLTDISNEILNIVYNNAFCFLYPSSYEGFGIPLLEAQNAGCPIISSNESSIPEIAGNGAILINNIDSFKIAEAINFMKKVENKRSSLINLGLENSKRFSWDKCFSQTKKIYEESI